jgi:hypothetical protein
MDDSPLERRRRRVMTIRKRVAAAAAALFIAVFGGITVQLALGHDPVLKNTTSAATTSTTSNAESTTQLSPVTTAQS